MGPRCLLGNTRRRRRISNTASERGRKERERSLEKIKETSDDAAVLFPLVRASDARILTRLVSGWRERERESERAVGSLASRLAESWRANGGRKREGGRRGGLVLSLSLWSLSMPLSFPLYLPLSPSLSPSLPSNISLFLLLSPYSSWPSSSCSRISPRLERSTSSFSSHSPLLPDCHEFSNDFSLHLLLTHPPEGIM